LITNILFDQNGIGPQQLKINNRKKRRLVGWSLTALLRKQTFNGNMSAYLDVSSKASAQLLKAVMNPRQQLIEQRQVFNAILIQHLI